MCVWKWLWLISSLDIKKQGFEGLAPRLRIAFPPPGGKVNMRYRDKPEREGLTAVEKHTSLARENVCRWNSSINNWKYSAFVAGGEVCDSGSMAGLVAAALGADGKLKPKINPGRYKN